MQKTLLWDIDGTLIANGGVGRRARLAAVSAHLGRDVVDDGEQRDGWTDPELMREILIGADVPEAELDYAVKHSLRRYGSEFAGRREELRELAHLHPGVSELLTRLDDEAVLSTIVSGNIAVNAVLKLTMFGLDTLIDLEVGGFGSDSATRSDLVAVARKRIVQKYGYDSPDEDVWVIGDTPYDLKAARVNEVRCLLVATGPYDYDSLVKLGPDAVLKDLSDVDGFYRAVFAEDGD